MKYTLNMTKVSFDLAEKHLGKENILKNGVVMNFKSFSVPKVKNQDSCFMMGLRMRMETFT